MTLYREAPGPFPVWDGEPVGGITHQRNIEQLWLAADLEAIGLWRDDMIASADVVPEGKQVVSTDVRRVDGVVKYVNVLEEAPGPTAEDVKAEANRRIIAVCPDWKQRNLTAQAVLLAKQVADGTPLSLEQKAAWEAGQALWMQIAAIRGKSDEIEAMSPIPRDFADDGYWS